MKSWDAFQSSTHGFQHFSSVQFKLIWYTHWSCCSWAKIKNPLVLHGPELFSALSPAHGAGAVQPHGENEAQKPAVWSREWESVQPAGPFSPVSTFYYARRAIPSSVLPLEPGDPHCSAGQLPMKSKKFKFKKLKALQKELHQWLPGCILGNSGCVGPETTGDQNSNCRGARSLQGFNVV